MKATELADDARGLTLDAFRSKHGEVFLLSVAGTLRTPKRFDETRSGPASPGAPGEWNVIPIVKRERSLSLVRVTVGRTANNDVHIEDASVSRLHAFLEPGPPWIVKDAGSRLGTRVNGEAISAPTSLRSGDQLAFGQVELTFMNAEGVVHFVQRLVAAHG